MSRRDGEQGEKVLGILQSVAFASMYIFNNVHFVIFFSFTMLVKAGDTLQRTFNKWLAGQPLLGHHLMLERGKMVIVGVSPGRACVLFYL